MTVPELVTTSLPVVHIAQATITVNVTIGADTATVLSAISDLGEQMSQAFDTAGAALDAVAGNVTELQAAEAEDRAAATAARAAFDALAAEVRAFIAGLPPAGGTLSAEDSAKAEAIVASLDASTVAEGTEAAGETAQAADEAALQAEVEGA
jgi:hypothetical protein